MSLRSDLASLIKHELDNAGIGYQDGMDLRLLTARYFELLTRRIVPASRRVHFSNELNHSLGKLIREPRAERRPNAQEAWRAVFRIRQLLAEGRNVTGFLSKQVDKLMFTDGLLWDFGIHHFHLNTTTEASGFVNRSDYLLLLPLESLNPSAELLDALNDSRCMSRKLSAMGFVVVEATTNTPIVVSLEKSS